MKLPFVSRVHHEYMVTSLSDYIAVLEHDNIELQNSINGVWMEKVAALAKSELGRKFKTLQSRVGELEGELAAAYDQNLGKGRAGAL